MTDCSETKPIWAVGSAEINDDNTVATVTIPSLVELSIRYDLVHGIGMVAATLADGVADRLGIGETDNLLVCMGSVEVFRIMKVLPDHQDLLDSQDGIYVHALKPNTWDKCRTAILENQNYHRPIVVGLFPPGMAGLTGFHVGLV